MGDTSKRTSMIPPTRWVVAVGAALGLAAVMATTIVRAQAPTDAKDAAGAATGTPVSSPSTEPNAQPSAQSSPSPPQPVPRSLGRGQINVSTLADLRAALMGASPGDVITVAPGVYAATDACTVPGGYASAHFCTNRPGTPEAPITLRGTGAVLKGEGLRSRYGLYLWQAPHWRITGITVRDASKGIVVDRSPRVVLDGVTVTSIGEEGVHFRSFSADGVIRNSEVSDTGLQKARFGEGVYVGSANSNWGKHSDGQPDRTDRVQVLGNRILRTRGEGVDIKEGTTGVVVRGNTFDGSKIAGENSADSWVDAKGNEALVEGNTGTDTPQDGFQSHTVHSGWGVRNVFRDNVARVNGPGYGFWMQSPTNVVACGQQVTGAGAGYGNVPCR